MKTVDSWAYEIRQFKEFFWELIGWRHIGDCIWEDDQVAFRDVLVKWRNQVWRNCYTGSLCAGEKEFHFEFPNYSSCRCL